MRLQLQRIIALGIAVGLTAGTSLRAENQKDIVDTAVGAGSFKTLAAALGAADLVGALKGSGPFTVFAPTDAAFAKLPEGTVASLLKPENKAQLVNILKYHVVSGDVRAADVVKLSNAKTLNGQRVDIQVDAGNVAIDSARVTATDIACSNGVIHVIDNVILPSSDNIPATAVKAGKFSTLVAAAKAAGLVEALSGDGPLTVFAPTDEAFAKLPSGTVDALLKPENKQRLVDILKYHVVPGRIFSDDALKAGQAKTLQGANVSIVASSSGAMVNDSRLIATDVDASNGVIHIIDKVLLPPTAPAQSTNARQSIEHSIARGVSMFNAGHHQACADEYEQTVRQLMTKEGSMPHATRQHLAMAVTNASNTQCSTTKAWTLRHALDAAYVTMSR